MKRRALIEFIRRGFIAAACGLAAAAAWGQEPPIKLEVDATDATRKILHAHLQFPVQPGPLTLLYPKWIPGEHAPDRPDHRSERVENERAGPAGRLAAG